MTARAAPTTVAAPALPLLGFAFLLSGAAALVYQIVWQRMLGIFAGSDAVTASIVVGAFLLGLGLGSLAAGLVADRLGPRRAAIAFALCEAGIAGFALLSKPFLYDLLAQRFGPVVDSKALVFTACFLGLLLPTFLMGCSLPLLARAAVTRIEGAADRIGRLYGANTVGAGVGALVGGFWLIGNVGFEASVQIGAALNLLAGVAVLWVFRRTNNGVSAPATAGTEARAQQAADSGGLRLWCLLVFASGFGIVALEILWVRILGLLFQSSAYCFATILAVFLVADGFGMIAGARVARRVRDPRLPFLELQAVAALYALVSLGLLYLLYSWTGLAEIAGADADRHRGSGLAVVGIIAVVLVAPPSFLLGMSFPFAQAGVQRDLASVGRRVGLVQLANILGNVCGSMFAGLVALHYFGTTGAAALIGAIAIALLLLGLGFGGFGLRQWAVATALLAAILTVPGNGAFWSAMHGATPDDRVYVAEGRSGVAFLRLRGGSGPFFISGFSQSNIPFAEWHGLLGVLGPLTHPEPRAVLVIGVGAGGTPYTAGIREETRSVRAIELVAPVYQVLGDYAGQHPDSAVAAMRRDPRYEWVEGDGRREIFAGGRRYDVIQADAILPESSMSGLLYSREFFALVRAALADGGIYVQWAPTPRTVATFASVFPHVVKVEPFPALIGSNQPIPFDPAAFARAIATPRAVAHLQAAGFNPDAFPALVAKPPRLWSPGSPREGDVNTDLFPRDEFYLNRRRDTP